MAENDRLMLIDSDVIIDHIRGIRSLPPRRLAFSVITRCELFAGRDDPEMLRKLLTPMQELPLNTAIAERGGTLKRDCRVATPDALIAATALEHEIPLMTRNVRHFRQVPGLDVRLPEE
jgi:predicted nucleic acid-binding protein